VIPCQAVAAPAAARRSTGTGAGGAEGRWPGTSARRRPVARLHVEPFQPLAVPGAAQLPGRLPGQLMVVAGVPTLDLTDVGAGRQSFGYQLADSLQHPGAGAQLGRVQVHEAVAGQRLGQLQRPVCIQVGHLGGRLDRPAAHEHGRDRAFREPMRTIGWQPRAAGWFTRQITAGYLGFAALGSASQPPWEHKGWGLVAPARVVHTSTRGSYQA
jgi:hypothetical protein